MRTLTASALFLGFATLASCQSTNDKPADTATAPPAAAETAVKVKLKTNHGTIVLLLDRNKAPITVDNFRKYVENKHYDGTVFHRVIGSFMIQGGGFSLTNGQLIEKTITSPTIRNESQNGLKNVRGSIAMARMSDPNSARAQFFISVVDNPMLDHPNNGGYAVFGKVVEGMDVVDKIKAIPTTKGSMIMRHPTTGQALPAMPAQDMPTSPAIIESAEILPAGS